MYIFLDIGNTYKRDTFSFSTHGNKLHDQSALQRRLSQATRAGNALARASLIKSDSSSMYIFRTHFSITSPILLLLYIYIFFFVKKMLLIIKILRHL